MNLTLHSILVIFQFDGSVCSPNFINFTFHSGYIPIFQPKNLYDFFTSLHSILVIFQFLLDKDTEYSIDALHSILVIFQ